MQQPQTNRMRHMSVMLPPEEREAFRQLCFNFDLRPSEALRAMVRIALGGFYDKATLHELAGKRGVQ